VTGIGGVFFRARNPERLRTWYAEHLGVELRGFGGAVFSAVAADITVWHVAPSDDEYFGAPEQRAMLNYRVRDLDAMLGQLRAAGVPIDEKRHQDENGRFAWVTDPEGNRIELFEPAPGH